MNYAVIDIGSNTVKCEVFSYLNNKLSSLDFISKQLGLVARIKNSRLSEDDISILCSTINDYKKTVLKYDPYIFCFATEGLRRISNLSEVTTAIKNNCDLDLEMISGKDEALFSYGGFKFSTPSVESGIMVDMGGGSTEILKFENGKVLQLNSFKFGCLSLRQGFVTGRFPTSDEKEKIQANISEELDKFEWIRNCPRLCLIGGTGSAIGKLAIELGYTTIPEFPIEIFTKLFKRLNNTNEECIKLLEKYIPARVETILPGMCAYERIIKTVNAETVYISKGGIRNGFLLSKLKEENS